MDTLEFCRLSPVAGVAPVSLMYLLTRKVLLDESGKAVGTRRKSCPVSQPRVSHEVLAV